MSLVRGGQTGWLRVSRSSAASNGKGRRRRGGTWRTSRTRCDSATSKNGISSGCERASSRLWTSAAVSTVLPERARPVTPTRTLRLTPSRATAIAWRPAALTSPSSASFDQETRESAGFIRRDRVSAYP